MTRTENERLARARGVSVATINRWIRSECAFFDELTAETRTPAGWEQDGSPNEAFDLYVYGSGICYLLNAEWMDWDNPKPWAAPWDENSEVREAREIAEASDGDTDPRPAANRPRRRRR